MFTREQLIEHLRENSRVLKDERVHRAFEGVDRALFVNKDYLVEAYEDYPLPIGYGQTISQPTTVAFMLEKLAADPGNKVLDVGSGSGWTTALLANIVGDKGEVYGVERVPELVDFGKKNLSKYDFANARIFKSAETIGLPKYAPFDRILVSAAANEIPEELIDQISEGGRMVIPIRDSVVVVKKVSGDEIEQEAHSGFAFVPLVE